MCREWVAWFRAVWLGACCGLALSLVQAAERAWEIEGEFVSLQAEEPEIVVLRTAGGDEVELPLGAFSKEAQAAIRELARAGRPVAASAADLPPALVEDLAACRTAADAADVCRLVLAGADLAREMRPSVETMLVEFEDRAGRGESRIGDRWVGPEVAAQAAEKADGHVAKSLEMIRLGNLKLAEQELRQASHTDPASGRADFLMGLAFMMGPKPDLDEAAKAFEEAVRREPENGAAWNNLAVCNVQRKRYPTAVAAFHSAAATLADPQAVVGNLAIVIRLATDRRSRISANQLDEVTGLYHELRQAAGIAAPDAVSGAVLLSPDGSRLPAGGLGDLRNLLPPGGGGGEPERLIGVVVAPGIVACSLSAADGSQTGELTIVTADGRSLAAGIAAREPTSSVVLLKCDGLDAAPLPVAPTSASAKERLLVVGASYAVAPSPTDGAPFARATMLGAAAGVGRPRFVYEPEPGSGKTAGDSRSVILDQAGHVAGLGVRQPASRRSTGARRLGLPAEVIWKLLSTIDPAIAPPSPESPNRAAGTLSVEQAAARCRSAMVLVRAGNPAGAAP